MPFGLVEATRATFVSRPRPWSAVTAFCSVWPTTFGTATFAPPFETPSMTVEAGGAFPPAGGFCVTTVPGACFETTWTMCGVRFAACSFLIASAAERPTTFGTATASGPLETVSLTFVPAGTSVSPAGSWWTTVSFGCFVCVLRIAAPSFRRRSSATAVCSFRPTTDGTVARWLTTVFVW